MKKNFVVLSLLCLMPFLAATEGMPLAGTAPMPVEEKFEWYQAPMIEAQNAFDRYYEFVAAHSPNTESIYAIDPVYMEAIVELNDAIQTIMDKEISPKINTLKEDGLKRFDSLVGTYCLTLVQESKFPRDNDQNIAAGLNNLYQYRSYLFDLGTFIGKTMNLVKDAEILSSLNIKTEVALRNDGYKKEYFLAEDVDNEKKDGLRYYFYSEPTTRPAMWRSLFGFGYTDKRSWGRYAFDKLKYPVALGVGAYAYYRNKEAVDKFGKQAFETSKDYAGRGTEFVSRHAKSFGKGVRRQYRNVTGETARRKLAKQQDALLKQQAPTTSKPSLWQRTKNFWTSKNPESLDIGGRIANTARTAGQATKRFWTTPNPQSLDVGGRMATAARDFTYAPRELVVKPIQRKLEKRRALKALDAQEQQALRGLKKIPLPSGDWPTPTSQRPRSPNLFINEGNARDVENYSSTLDPYRNAVKDTKKVFEEKRKQIKASK